MENKVQVDIGRGRGEVHIELIVDRRRGGGQKHGFKWMLYLYLA